MRVFDCHSHWSTRKGYVLQTEEELESQRRIWGTAHSFQTEQELAATLRKNNVRAIMDLGITAIARDAMPIEKVRELHNYVFEQQRAHPDVYFGNWLSLDPRLGKESVKEFERALELKPGFVGAAIVGQAPHGYPASDPVWDPLYKLSIDAGVPVLIHCGLTGIGQGQAGGGGIVLDHGHPRHIDMVAARYPQLKILAARPGYPWQTEMIAVLLHKANVHYELHGWSPKTFSPELKREIAGRLQDRIMFGCDYPVLKYEMMLDRWKGLDLSETVLNKVLHKNAEAYFAA